MSDMSDAQVPAKVGYQTRTVTRALAILDAFVIERRPLSLKDLHLLLELPKPTLSRLARELERAGYLQLYAGVYELGPKTFELGALFGRQHRLEEVGKALLESLAAETMQAACLALRTDIEIVHVMVCRSPRPVQYVTDVGNRAFAHATALGKAILSSLSSQELKALFKGRPLPKLTPNTISSMDQLVAELRRIKKRGYSIDDEESALGLRCVAVGLELPGFGRSAISVAGPAADFDEESIPVFAAAAQRTADQLTASLSQASIAAAALPA